MFRTMAAQVAVGIVFGVAVLGPRVLGQGASQDPAAAPAAESGLSPEVKELIAAHNRERAAAKLEPLTANPKLQKAALLHARDMAEHEKMSHEGSDGSKFNERIERQDYHGLRTGENVAAGQRSVDEVMSGWMNSPHHRENILGKFSEIGVARVNADNGTPYWCADFGLAWTRLDRESAVAGVVEAVNRAREKAEKPPLTANPKLVQAAQNLAEDLASHGTLREGDATTAERIKRAGYAYRMLGESAAQGQATAEDAVKSWLDSPMNRENFLGAFTEIGAGYATDAKGTPFWAVFLGKPAR